MYNHDYYDRIAYEGMFYEFVEEKMKEQRIAILEKLQAMAPAFAESFANILCVAYENDSTHAAELWNKFGFDASDFFAITNNTPKYLENYRATADLEAYYE
jgi:hypothetical protein